MVYGMKQRGFTLVELMVVIVIIGMLFAILIPMVGKMRREAAITAQRSNFRSIMVALDAYKADFGDYPRPVTRPVTGAGQAVYASQLLCWALIAPGVQGPALVTDPDILGNDGADGPGFRSRRLTNPPVNGVPDPHYYYQGKVYGPYLSPDKFKWSTAAVPEVLDNYGNPMLYYPAPARVPHPITPHSYADDSRLGIQYKPMFDVSDNDNSRVALAALRILLNSAADGSCMDPDQRIRPHCKDPFFLWSAGPDGIFGTEDDVTTVEVGQ